VGTATRIEFLTTHDMERPALVARPEDELRCAEAFYEFLVEREPGWTFLQLVEQDATSPLAAAAQALDSRFHVRHFPNNPNATLELDCGFERWFAGLRSMRKNVKEGVRDLFKKGEVEFLACEGRTAAREQLELYVGLEKRSWKVAAGAGISRHPERVELFRAMLGDDQAATPLFHWLLVDGLPIAASLALLFHRTVYGMELAFDSEWRTCSPGNVLVALLVRDAAARGARALNMLGNFAYHKAHWNARVTETAAVQVFRRFSLHHARAVAGDLKRRLVGGDEAAQAAPESKTSKPRQAEATVDPVLRDHARRRGREVFAALEASGAPPSRVRGAALQAAFKAASAAG
jgi:hypothetical protein